MGQIIIKMLSSMNNKFINPFLVFNPHANHSRFVELKAGTYYRGDFTQPGYPFYPLFQLLSRDCRSPMHKAVHPYSQLIGAL